MPVKRRTSKSREELTDNARAWLRGGPCGFFKFKDHAYLGRSVGKIRGR